MTRHYLFADESGNFDFSRSRGATRYFGVGTVHVVGDEGIDALRRDLLRSATELAWRSHPATPVPLRRDLLRSATELAWRGDFAAGGFHASEDTQVVRDAVFAVLRRHELFADTTVFEKAKVPPAARPEPADFFAHAWRVHFSRVLPRLCEPADEVMVAVAAIGTRRTRAAFRTMLDAAVRGCVTAAGVRVVFAPAESDPGLQAADYVTWAVTRACERGDSRALDSIAQRVRSQHDATADEAQNYY